MVHDAGMVDYLHVHLEKKFSHHADSNKAANRARVLRRILEKAVSLHSQLHQQRGMYFVEWIKPGSYFSAETMQLRSEEVVQDCSRVVVQYCHQPMIRKVAQDGDDRSSPNLVVIVRAIVICRS